MDTLYMARKITRKTSKTKSNLSAKVFVGVIVAGLFISVGSVMYGRADEGVINVAEVIDHSNTAARESGDEGAVVKNPSANTRSRTPNGGLVGTGKPEKPAQQTQPEATMDEASTTVDGSDADDEDASAMSDETESEATTTEATAPSED